MGVFLVKRLLGMIPVLILVSGITFSLMALLPGDPATAMLGEHASQQDIASLHRELGLDRPLYVQYAASVSGILHGDLGLSFRTHQPVVQLIGQRALPTATLTVAALVLALLVALPLGILSALRRGSWLDSLANVLTLGGTAMPHFWLGVMLILFFAVRLRVLPASGFVSPFDRPMAALPSLVLPTVTLSVGIVAELLRQIRASMLDVMGQDFVTTARAKGLWNWLVVRDHILRNALIPVITVAGLIVGRLLGGAVITETIFAIPGLGRLAADSIFERDFPTIQGVVLVTTLAVLACNFAVDMLYGFLDPRIRHR